MLFRSEGLLNDKRFVSNAHLHHKNLHLRAALSPTLSLSIGLEHYVIWGGKSPIYGQLPEWSQYFRYVAGLSGGEGATLNDQMNGAGNQLGSYNLELKKDWQTIKATFYWNHPYEDRSGREFANMPDGLWGIHLAKTNRAALITDVVYEYMNTCNQSGSILPHPAPTLENPNRISGRGGDNYFNHLIYSSGYTYYQRMMGTPIFIPVIGADGISKGFNDTSFWMHHLGIGGTLGSGFYWESLTTWSRNYGGYGEFNFIPRDEFSFFAEGSYNGTKLPFIVKAGLAGDYGDLFEQRTGGYLGIEFNF